MVALSPCQDCPRAPPTPRPASRLAALLCALASHLEARKQRRAHRRAARKTARTLGRLGDAPLADIGIERDMIDTVAAGMMGALAESRIRRERRR